MRREVIEVDLDKISPNLRLIYHSDSIEGQCCSIRSRGQVEPIQVWFDGECFRILDGEIRWRACKKLGIGRVKVIIVEVSFSFRDRATF